MVHQKYFPLLLALLALLVFSVPVLAETAQQTAADKVTNNGVTLEVWQNSSHAERYAYLLGLMTMVEMEKNWQGSHPLPFKQSLVPSWSKGLADLTFKQIADTVDNYIISNPNDGQRQVVEVLWFQLVAPKLAMK